MSILNNSLLLGADAGAAGYQIERSLRFNSSDSAYCGRSVSSAGNRRIFTLSLWCKLSVLADGANVFKHVFQREPSASAFPQIKLRFERDSDKLFFGEESSEGVYDFQVATSAVFRDVSAWYHLVISVDTQQSTSSNRVRIYVNGNLASLSLTSYPSQNFDTCLNQSNEVLSLGRSKTFGEYFDGYLADIHFIDGQALDPTSFAETNITTGQWVPKAYTGTYGTNGFRLAFADNSNNTATTLGKDSSPNGNNWTPNNLSVTAGAGNDSLVDTPTSYGTDTGAGGEVRGNYATLNPLNKGSAATLSNGNLDYSATGATSTTSSASSTVGVASGKWYWEVTLTSSSADIVCGVAKTAPTGNGLDPNLIGFYLGNGDVYNQGATISSYGSSFATNDVLGIALDVDAGKIWFSKNGSWMGSGSPNPATGTSAAVSSGIAGFTWFADLGHGGANVTRTCSLNFGARSFAYTAPSGFKALCDTNLPAPVVAKPNSAFDVKLYNGNGSSQTISGLGFSPDLVWTKSRSNGGFFHRLQDTVRGATKELYSNSTNAEGTNANSLTAFNSDGFTLGSESGINGSGETFVAWNWDAGSSTVTNTQGSITSQVRANASAGFSIVSYASGAVGQKTVGHGLNVAPSFIITKSRTSATFNWVVYHASVTDTTSKYLRLNTTDAVLTFSTVWGAALPTSTVFGITSDGAVVANTDCIAYCFAPVAGYSSFGSYTGNGSADGPFVYTGMRPRWLLIKVSNTTGDWILFDSARATYNGVGPYLFPNTAGAENSTGVANDLLDMCSNGFKLRGNYANTNQSSSTYVYAAFAENPFQYARAR